MPQRNLLHVALLYAAALASGYAMSLLRVPLPWMIGPMVLAAIISLAGKRPTIPWITRPIGQLVVAASVGLFFTPAALTAVSQQIVPMIVVAVLTIAAGFFAALVLMRLAHIDVVSASLASIPGGPVEMARDRGTPRRGIRDGRIRADIAHCSSGDDHSAIACRHRWRGG